MPTHKYEVNQKLLCFEPDDSKAKVIYLAKILKRIPKRSGIPCYMVHFQGWKGKWDREVPENLLLDNTDFNRTLKRKIDDVVRNVRCRVKRKQRIDQILEFASVCGDEIDWEKIPGIWTGRRTSKQPKSEPPSDNPKESYTSSEKTEKVTLEDSGSTSTHDDDDSLQIQYEQLQVHQAFRVPVNLPPGLQAILRSIDNETTPQCIGWCSVLQLLQCYVDEFPYTHTANVIPKCPGQCPDRVQRILGSAYLQTDQNRLLCVDVCSSLRVLFDLNVGSCLRHSDALETSSRTFSNGGCAFTPGQHVPPSVEPMFRYSSPRYELLPEVEAARTPNLPCLSYPAGYLLRLFPTLPQLLDDLTMTECKRAIVTRHIYLLLDYLERTRSFWFTTGKQPQHAKRPRWDSQSVDVKPQLPVPHHMVSKTASESSASTEPLVQSIDHSGRISRSRRRGVCYATIRSIINPNNESIQPSHPEPSRNRVHERPASPRSFRARSGSGPKGESRSTGSPAHSRVTHASSSRSSTQGGGGGGSIKNRVSSSSSPVHIDRILTRRSHTLRMAIESKASRSTMAGARTARKPPSRLSSSTTTAKKRVLRPRI